MEDEFKREMPFNEEDSRATFAYLATASSSFCPKRRHEKSSPKNPKEKKKRRERLSKKKTPFYANKIMVKLTMIARVLDGLPLAEGLDTDATLDLEYYKQQAKTLFKKLSSGAVPPSRMSYESGEYFMHYVIENGVCYLTLCDRNYPKKLAYSYLEGERKRFLRLSLARAVFDRFAARETR